MLFRLSLSLACRSIQGDDDSTSLLAAVHQVRRHGVEDQFEVDLVNHQPEMNLAAISCPFMKTASRDGMFSRYPQAAEDEVMFVMQVWRGGPVIMEKFRSVYKSAVDHQGRTTKKQTLNVEDMHGNIVEHIDSTGMFDPTADRVRFYTTLACKAGGAASVPCDEAAGRRAAADTSNAKFITFETLKAANSTFLALHAASLAAGTDMSGPQVRWWVPFALMLDMFGEDVPNGPAGMKGIGVEKFEKLFFDGQLPHFNFQPWEVTSPTSQATPTVLLAEALLPTIKAATTTPMTTTTMTTTAVKTTATTKAAARPNVYTKVPNVGAWGGQCTCPDGKTYNVGDHNNACGSLACVGGVAGRCSPVHSDARAGMQVTCGSVPNVYTKVTGVGAWGGQCTCPDGKTYDVGDHINFCGSLACIGGVAGQCSPVHSDARSGMQVTCR